MVANESQGKTDDCVGSQMTDGLNSGGKEGESHVDHACTVVAKRELFQYVTASEKVMCLVSPFE